MIGLGSVAPGAKTAKPVIDPEAAKEMFAWLYVAYNSFLNNVPMTLIYCRPGSEAAVLLATYDFVHANKLFCFNFVTLPAEKGLEAPISSFLSVTSYPAVD
jgi:hypothetical protein